MIKPEMKKVVESWLKMQIRAGATDEQILATYQKENTKQYLIDKVKKILSQQRKAA